MRPSVMLVGSYPPPYGGCSVHVERLRQALVDDFDVVVVDLYGSADGSADSSVVRCGRVRPFNILRALKVLRRAQAGLVHFHVAGMDAFLLAGYPMLAVLPATARKVVTIHSGSFVARFAGGPAWRRSVLRDLLRRFDRIVTVNDAQRAFLERVGILAAKIAVVPAFLPPVAAESPRVLALLDSIRPYDRIVVASGYGLPYYGFHVVLDALEQVTFSAGRIATIFCTYNSYDEAYMTSLTARLSARGSSALVRDLAPSEFAWLVERCDVYVRATDRDGDAVAVREALHYGKTVIASDCVPRPPQVYRFRTGDAASLADALDDVFFKRVSAGDYEAVDTISALRSIYAEAWSS